ncbi:MAG: hypothetical protein IJY06_07990 [Oscillospiraceae bacterium]|nr:hypothetical protein [Oscillospiraceae bacterium]
MKYRGFYVKISQESVSRVDKDGNEVQCAGFMMEIFENERSAIPLDRISAAVDFELLEPSVAEAEQFVKDYIDSEVKYFEKEMQDK